MPGAANRRRIRELEAQIHHLDKAPHYAELGDIYLHMGRLDTAETCYRAALERESEDLDSRAHLGLVLQRKGRHEEALELLLRVCEEQPDHDYGYSSMALAETYRAVGRGDDAIKTLEKILERHAYARARLTLAELLVEQGDSPRAVVHLQEVVEDDAHAPTFQRRRDRPWVRRAKRLLRQLPPA